MKKALQSLRNLREESEALPGQQQHHSSSLSSVSRSQRDVDTPEPQSSTTSDHLNKRFSPSTIRRHNKLQLQASEVDEASHSEAAENFITGSQYRRRPRETQSSSKEEKSFEYLDASAIIDDHGPQLPQHALSARQLKPKPFSRRQPSSSIEPAEDGHSAHDPPQPSRKPSTPFLYGIPSRLFHLFSAFLGLVTSVFRAFGLLITAFANGAKNLAGSPFFGFIISCLMILLVGMVILALIAAIRGTLGSVFTGAKEFAVDAGNLAIAAAETSWGSLVAMKEYTKDVLIAVGSGTVGVLGAAALTTKGTLCRSTYGTQAVQWFGYSCDSAEQPDVMDTLNCTALAVGEWANSSDILIPYSDYFKTMNLGLGHQQLLIALTMEDFAAKDELVALINDYSNDLLWGGRLMYDTVLATEDLLILMLNHFFEAEKQLRAISMEHAANRSWLWLWYETRQLEQTLIQLLHHLDTRLVSLVKVIDNLDAVLQDCISRGERYGRQLKTAQKTVKAQIEQRGLYFKYLSLNSDLHQTLGLLTPIDFSLVAVKKQVQSASNDIYDLRSKLKLSGENIHAVAFQLRPQIDTILKTLKTIVDGLASTKAHMEVLKVEGRRRREDEIRQGTYSHPNATGHNTP